MRVENDTIKIESRSEIDTIQNMIDTYMQSGKANASEKEDLERLKGQLEGLWFSW